MLQTIVLCDLKKWNIYIHMDAKNTQSLLCVKKTKLETEQHRQHAIICVAKTILYMFVEA